MEKISVAQCNQKPITDCLALEWLETNGLGGYTASTLLNCHTRKYHGLLVSKLLEPFGVFVLLSKFDDQFITDTQSFPLSTHQYLDAMVEGGYSYLDSFDQNECIATFHYLCQGIPLRKQILLCKNKNTLLVKYSLAKGATSALPKISLRPFLAYRNVNTLTEQNPYINSHADHFEKGIQFKPYAGMPRIMFYSDLFFSYNPEPYWYRHFAYTEEKDRGYAYEEDLFTPGKIECTFDQNNEIILACSIEEMDVTPLNTLWQQESNRNASMATSNTHLQELCEKAQQLIILLPDHTYSIKAGYYWFSQWGRDAMISMPGLTLYSGQEQIGVSILKHFSDNEHLGLIPNRVATAASKENEYDNVDGSLWFIWAVQQYYLKTRDNKTIQKIFWPTIKNIIHHYRNGTLFNIHQLENGLIYAGTPLVKTTWMDVKINDIPLTPRNGMQVEVNALWYNALCFSKDLATQFKDPLAKELKPLITLVKENYSEVFWDNTLQYLRDFVNEIEINKQLRPNQIIAAALPYSPLSKTVITKIIEAVSTQLLTPCGLRTLAQHDPAYHGIYFGDQTTRDKAYHNGTVWPWLLCFYTEALLKIYSRKKTLTIMQPCINRLKQHFLTEAGLGGISEIFDGDAPHHARGCVQQAWSIAEFIRLIDLLTK